MHARANKGGTSGSGMLTYLVTGRGGGALGASISIYTRRAAAGAIIIIICYSIRRFFAQENLQNLTSDPRRARRAKRKQGAETHKEKNRATHTQNLDLASRNPRPKRFGSHNLTLDPPPTRTAGQAMSPAGKTGHTPSRRLFSRRAAVIRHVCVRCETVHCALALPPGHRCHSIPMSPASASTRNLAIVSGRRISASTCAPGIAPGGNEWGSTKTNGLWAALSIVSRCWGRARGSLSPRLISQP